MGNKNSSRINDLPSSLAQCGANQHIDIKNIVMVSSDGNRYPVDVKKLTHSVSQNDKCESCHQNDIQDIVLNVSDEYRKDIEYLIQCVYSEQTPDLEERIDGILYTITSIKSLEFQFLCFDTIKGYINLQNVIKIWISAKHQQCLSLEQYTKNLILDNFKDIVEDKSFLFLECEHMDELLKSDDIYMVSEEKIFETLKKWCEAESGKRKQYFCSLLKNIRLVLLQPEYCMDTIFPLCEPCQDCYRVIKDFLKWKFMPEMRSDLKSIIATPRQFGFALIEVITDQSFIFQKLEIYNVDCEAWQSFADLDNKISCSSVASLEDNIYFFGGKNKQKTVNSVWGISISTKETVTVSSMQENRHLFTSTAISGKIIACGGQNDENESLKSVEMWDPPTNSWKNLSPMLTSRRSHGATVCNNRLYVIGGFSDREYLNTIEKYDPTTDTWYSLPPMKHCRRGHGVVTLDNCIYVIGGYNGEFLSSVERFDTITQCWSDFVNILTPQGGNAVRFLNQLHFFGEKEILKFDSKEQNWIPDYKPADMFKRLGLIIKTKYLKKC